MTSRVREKAPGKKQIVYGIADGENAVYAVAESAFEYTASCPMCNRRVFDTTNIPGNLIYVRLKCPHCRNIVNIPFSPNL